MSGRLYAEHGWAIAWTDARDAADLDAGKRCRGWKGAKVEHPDFADAHFAGRIESRNPAVVLSVSGLIGVDIDGPTGADMLARVVPEGLPSTVTALSGRQGGEHHYFRPSPGWRGPLKIEFGADGKVTVSDDGYLVAPPAIHANGRRYRFAAGLALGEVEVAELPVAILERIVGAKARPTGDGVADPGAPIPEGGRRSALLTMAGAMRRQGMGAKAILAGLVEVNAERCHPPLPEDEVEALAADVAVRYDPAPERAAAAADPPVEPPVFRVVPVGEFAAVDESSAEALLGDDDNTVLSSGGMLVFYGKGGGGKTTLELDLVMHLAAGVPWLGLPVPRRCRVLLIENEGPRGKFRLKWRAKLASWRGPSVEGYLHVLETPWAQFTFADEGFRRELAATVRERSIDVLAAGPVQRLGVTGGGTPEEVAAFVGLVEQVRADLDRPLAGAFVHHANKGGTVSGAWEGVPDTLAHVAGQGNGSTRVEWEKVRWGSDLHGRAWKLLWREGEGFELDEAPEVTDDDIRAGILAAVEAHPGGSANLIETTVTGGAARIRAVRDELLGEGAVTNLGGGKGGTGGGGMKLYLAGSEPEQGAFVPSRTNAQTNGSSTTEGGVQGPFVRSSRRKEDERRTNGSHGPPGRCDLCGKRLEPTERGEPVCRCDESAEDDLDRWERMAAGGES